jgi:hypothetical protein
LHDRTEIYSKVLHNTVSVAIKIDTHFGATKSVLLEATYHWYDGNWACSIFFQFISLLRPAGLIVNFLAS